MPDFRSVLLVSGGAVAGALLRWGLAAALPSGALPWGVLVVNVAGSFLVGFVALAGSLSTEARLLVVVGFAGALTTMSAFALDTVALLDAGEWRRAALNVLANPLLSVGAAYLGLLLARAVGR